MKERYCTLLMCALSHRGGEMVESKSRCVAHPGLDHWLLQLGEFARNIDAKLPLHVPLNISSVHLALDMLACDLAKVHLELNGVTTCTT